MKDYNIVQNDDNVVSNVAVMNQTDNNTVKEDPVSEEKRKTLNALRKHPKLKKAR